MSMRFYRYSVVSNSQNSFFSLLLIVFKDSLKVYSICQTLSLVILERIRYSIDSRISGKQFISGKRPLVKNVYLNLESCLQPGQPPNLFVENAREFGQWTFELGIGSNRDYTAIFLVYVNLYTRNVCINLDSCTEQTGGLNSLISVSHLQQL